MTTPEASDGQRTFEDLLADPYEQYDARSELLASILAYTSAPPTTASSKPMAARPGGTISAKGIPEIRIWRFRDAPQHLRDLSPHGGDEDWLALIPADFADMYIGWLEAGSGFGVCDVSEHPLPDGSVVKIWTARRMTGCPASSGTADEIAEGGSDGE